MAWMGRLDWLGENLEFVSHRTAATYVDRASNRGSELVSHTSRPAM